MIEAIVVTKPVRWQRINADGYEYAIVDGIHGDEFVKGSDGRPLRRLGGKEAFGVYKEHEK